MSSSKQKDDLQRQVQEMQSKYPGHDVASGLNFKRKGLKRLLESVQDGNIQEIVVAHKDRLARFGAELIEWIASRAGACIIYEDNNCLTSEQELAADLLAIVHVFSCRANGKRRYGKVNARGKESEIGGVQGEVSRREKVFERAA